MTNRRRRAILERYSIRPQNPSRVLYTSRLDQIEGCKDDPAVRLLLGKSERFSAEELAANKRAREGEPA